MVSDNLLTFTAHFMQEEYANKTAAVNAVKTNAVWGALHFPKNYTKSTIQMARHKYNASLEDFHGSRIEAWLDTSGRFATRV